MTIASATIDSHGDLDITGVSSGRATVTQTDSSGPVVVTSQTYHVIVTP
jgi:hypothetical protein